ncbi:ephexin-1-like [Antedon mediterranea]|uniref:ephexin-1-like n=1 Tax=Antedon mediterranea TaxID=105859 RepID=UPI003AF56C95
MEYPVITHDAHAQPQKVSLPEEAIDRGRHSVFQEQIEEQSQDVDQQENQIIHYNQDELSDDSFLDYDTEPEDKETTSQTVHPPDRFNVHVDPMYDDNVYEEPYVVFSAFNDNTLVPTTTKERKGQKSFKKRFGALSFARRRKSSQIPSEQTGGKTEFDIEACCDSREIYANVNRDVQTTETLFKEFVDFVSKCLEDLNALNSRYVTNAALNPQNGILQDGEYRRLFARIPKLIQFLDDLLDDLKKCKPLNDSLICQLLLDVVTTDFLNAFQDYTVNSRFQEFTLSYLRKRRIAFNQIVKSQEKTVDICSSACRHHTLDGLLKQPCYFLQQLNLYIKRLQGIIKKTNNPEANVVRLAHDLTQNMNAIVNECEEQDNKLQEREERHVSKILLRMHFRHSDSVISSEEIQISNESWVESWNDVIVFSCKKSDGKDWKKAGSNVKLVIFERVVMVINEKQHKSDGQNGVYYKLIDCANKNFVEVEKPSSDTYPFKIPTRKGLTMNVFLIVMHNDTCPERRLYYVCWEPSQKRSFEIWRKHLTVPSGDSGEQYASWSRPKYKIVEHFLGTERGELRVNLGDEVEITEKADGWVRAVHLGNNNQGWIPKSCLGDLIPSMFTRGMNIRQQRRIRNDGHTHHSVIIRKDKKGNKHDRKK